ncbi:AI-2E family transporter [Actinoplanes sp. NPDC026619]|uniref:AI-2E family transporter n=1 Tax=Actinoplanes sp. NPDC026619 TaxID=3155798 RepID=UPI0033D4225E
MLAALVFALAAYLAARVLLRVAPMTMAVIVALLVTALVGPLVGWLERHHVPRSLAAFAGLAVVLGLIGAASYLIGRRAVGQLGDLQEQAVEGVRRLRHTLAGVVPGVDERRIDKLAAELVRGIRQALPSPYAGITSATEVLAAILLAIVLVFFFLRDGAAMWSWLVARTPGGGSERIDRAGRAGWRTLAGYTHGIVVIAAVDAVGIGAALFLLQVPLALSLAVLTFLAAFIPIVGATVAGAAATLVTLVTNGTQDALIVLAAVILVQQAEGNLLHPLVMRRAVSLHPVVTLLAVSAGTLLGGVAGALIAVPACAVVYHAALGYRGEEPALSATPDRTEDDVASDSPDPGSGGDEAAE